MAQTPSFFKIILEDVIREGKIGIPKKFVRKYGNYFSEKVFLKVPSGARWKVELQKNADGICLGNGWQDFADYYSISYGSFLVFEVEDFKTCSFNVVIFDTGASEINYPFQVGEDNEEEPNLEKQVHQPINHENNHEDVWQTRRSEDRSPLPFSRPCEKMKQENCSTQTEEPQIAETDVSPPRKLEKKSVPPFSRPREKTKNITGLPQANGDNKDSVVKQKQRLTTEERANAIAKAKNNCKPNNLSFSIVMRPTHVAGDYRVTIPGSFADKYLKKWRGNIILHSVDGKSWSVGYNSDSIKGGKMVRVSRGWREFVATYDLKVGDVCVFEAIDHNATDLKVVIYRENQDTNTSPPIGNQQHLNHKEIPCSKAINDAIDLNESPQ